MKLILATALLCLASVSTTEAQDVGPQRPPISIPAKLEGQAFSETVWDRRIPERWVQGDAWLSPDKFKHLYLAFGSAGITYTGARYLGADPREAYWASFALNSAIGIAKEAWDASQGKEFCLKDLAWTEIGLWLGLELSKRLIQ